MLFPQVAEFIMANSKYQSKPPLQFGLNNSRWTLVWNHGEMVFIHNFSEENNGDENSSIAAEKRIENEYFKFR